SFTLGPIVFNGNHVVAIIVVPLALAGLAWFFGHTDTGVAVRAAADSNDRALLLGIPVRRLSLVTWMLAAGLSGVGAMLSAPILGPNLGVLAGPQVLLGPLAAAVLAGMDSLPTAFVAALGIGVFEQAVFWSYPRSTTVDVALFGLVLVGLLARRSHTTRGDDPGLGDHVAIREVRPISAVMKSLPQVRAGRAGAALALVLLLVVGPLAMSNANRTLLAYVAIYGILATSLVVLTGWSGQVSLGQFAFAGVGAATTAGLLVHQHLDLFLALMCAGAVGAAVAVVVGIPALRMPGLLLAVATMAFAVPVSTYLLNSTYFPQLTPASLERPVLLQRFRLDSPVTFYYLCLAVLALSVLLAHNLRRSRAGRVLLAVRDNERGAASFSIRPIRAKLVAFALSGALAGVAGGLYAVGLRGIGFSGYDPTKSVQVFSMVVVGGLASLPGGLLGAAYVQGARYFLHGALQLLATGGGVLFVLMALPGGLGDVLYRIRDALLRAVARSEAMSVPTLTEGAAFDAGAMPGEGSGSESRPGRSGLITCDELDASYGQVQALFGVELSVAEGEVIALLGTNGAGKSTLLRVMSGLMQPTRGRIEFARVDVTRWSPIQRVRAGLVTVPGGRGVFPSLTVAENLRLGAWILRHDRAFVNEANGRVNELFPALASRMGVKASALSGGEQQMLTLAQALLCRPRLLLIDELSLGLAPAVVASLIGVVRSFAASGVTVVVVEQSVNVATAIARRAVFMERGQVRYIGTTSKLVERDDLLRSVFLGHAAASTSSRRAARALPIHRPGSPEEGVRAADEPPALELVGISRRFGGVAALDGTSLSVADGEIVGIIGANGAGKTTLFDVCSGFLAPDSGQISLRGREVTLTSAPERASLGLGRVFQGARLFPSLTVAETLAVALERTIEVRDPLACMARLRAAVDSERRVAERVGELIETMGLSRYRDSFVSELSTGTRRVVELACALAHSPDVLLLDEPSSGIAQRESEALRDLLAETRDRTGATFVIIEHDVPLVSALADRLVCLHLGRVIADGRPEEVLRDPGVIAAYLGTDQTTVARSGSILGRRSDGRGNGRAAPGAGRTPAGARRRTR
ncbi:MAG: ATP-binding cassette domain-containing protein, partial [Acidimicrobiales bacterium]